MVGMKKCRQQGMPVPRSRKAGDEWSADAKLAIVIETAPLSEIEFGAYCREKAYTLRRRSAGKAPVSKAPTDTKVRKKRPKNSV